MSKATRRAERVAKLKASGLFSPSEIARRRDWSDARVSRAVGSKKASFARTKRQETARVSAPSPTSRNVPTRKVGTSRITRLAQFRAWSVVRKFPSDYQQKIDQYNDEAGLSRRDKNGHTIASYGYRRFYNEFVNGYSTDRARRRAERGGS